MSGFRYSMATIAEAVGGSLSMGVGTGTNIDRVIIDSRHADTSPGALFVALNGPRHDGHDHIAELRSKGVCDFLVRADRRAEAEGVNAIIVEDTLEALQRFAAWHRSHFDIPVIGITGSNGKTIVKEWLFQMLHREENIVRSPGSWNSQVGVPLSVLQMGPEHTLGIFEAGISQPGEMERLEHIISPTIGVLTNIGDAHDGGFRGDRALKRAEKRKLFARSAVVICQRTDSEQGSTDLLIGQNAGDFVEVEEAQVLSGSCSLDISHAGASYTFNVPFDDNASVENAIICIAVCMHLGHSPAWISERLAQLAPVDMRMRTLHGAHDTTLIDDSYSLDKTSLFSALDHLRRAAHGRPMAAVISDLAESVGDPSMLYQEVANALRLAGVSQTIGVGPGIASHRAMFGPEARFHTDVESLLRKEDPRDLAGSVVLIKGARRFGFERIVEHWQQQVHGTELEIDLEAIRHNLNHYRALVKPGVRTMAMVKAFGYGSGALELARLFEHERVHYLGVAYADEGIELRTHGITMPIMVMNPEPVDMGTLHRFRLETEVYDDRSLVAAIKAAERSTDPLPIHLKLDVGMHRLGFTEEELPALLARLRALGPLKVASLLTHMAAAEDPRHDEFTRASIARFERMSQDISAALAYTPLRHMANSAGIARWPQAHFDMVRLGIGLHGIGSDAAETAQLQPTVTLRTLVAQVKTIGPGESVSYGRRFVAQSPTRVATLPIGYADGLSRRLGNGRGKAWIQGRPARFLGSICMDMCMVDVTDIPCGIGDEVILFGPEHPLQEYADDLETIPYEALTSISQRVKRVYVRG